MTYLYHVLVMNSYFLLRTGRPSKVHVHLSSIVEWKRQVGEMFNSVQSRVTLLVSDTCYSCVRPVCVKLVRFAVLFFNRSSGRY
jgi:hypothetical protein